ncbi:MAG: hypothetical protein DRP87_17685, partial [Spirochaetes bacterium]
KYGYRMQHNSLFFPVLTMTLIPVFDTLAAILRRVRRKKPIHFPDKDHIHHKLLFFGFSNVKILIVTYSICILAGFASLFRTVATGVLSLVLIIAVWVVCIFLFILLDRLYRRK